MFARVLIEVNIDQNMPDSIMFESEKGVIVEQQLEYEWRPLYCPNCSIYGHTQNNCGKGVSGSKKWIPKTKRTEPNHKEIRKSNGNDQPSEMPLK